MGVRKYFCCKPMFFAALFFWLFAAPGYAVAIEPKHVLFINSYHEGYKGTDDIVAGFRSTISESLEDVYIKTEYLDSKNFSGDEYDAKFLDLLRYKYQKHHFDLVVASDDYAFNFVDKNYKDLFAPTPVVFCGTNAFDERRLEGKSTFVGIDESPSFRETIELMLQLRPGTKQIVAITDDSLAGRLNSDHFHAETRALAQKVRLEVLAGMPLEDILTRVRAMKDDTQGIYFASFIKDRSGKSYSSGDAVKILSSASQVPIYGGWEFNLGNGIVGGKLVNLREHGALAGRLAAEILKGKTPSSLARLSPSPNIYMFDDVELRRFGIQYGGLPEGSRIINRPQSFYERNRAEIFIAVSLFLAFLVLCFISFLYRSRRNLQRALQEIKTLEGILPICSSCKKIRDEEDRWQPVERYISTRSEAKFSHGLCPDCARKLYPDFF